MRPAFPASHHTAKDGNVAFSLSQESQKSLTSTDKTSSFRIEVFSFQTQNPVPVVKEKLILGRHRNGLMGKRQEVGQLHVNFSNNEITAF